MQVIKSNSLVEPFQKTKIEKILQKASQGLSVDLEDILVDIEVGIYDGVNTKELHELVVDTCLQRVQEDPDYSQLAARVLLFDIYKQALGKNAFDNIKECHETQFETYLTNAVEKELLNPELLNTNKFDIDVLAYYIRPERDLEFRYNGLHALQDRYLMRDLYNGYVMETPQYFWMRVAMGVSLNEDDPTARALNFYNAMSTMRYLPSTPTLFNAGTNQSQLSSCFLLDTADDMIAIGNTLTDIMQLSKYSGGIGGSITKLRATGSILKTLQGKSGGPIPFIKMMDAVVAGVDQGGKRRGTMAVYMEPWHYDVERFIDLKRRDGDHEQRVHSLNTVLFLNDEFMQRVQDDQAWYLFDPNEAKDLTETYGHEFSVAYNKYVIAAQEGKIRMFKTVKARTLFQKMLKSLIETSHPWLTFKDPGNIRCPLDGMVHSSNLCCITEDQRVVTENGLIPVGELYLNGGKNCVMGRFEKELASEMLLPRPDAPIVRILTKEGYTHKVTPDHKVSTLNMGQVRAQDLVVGDKIELQQVEGLFGSSHNPELAFLAGLIASDGTFSANSVCIDLWENKTWGVLDKVDSCYEHLLGNKPRWCKPIGDIGKRKIRLNSWSLADKLSNFGFVKNTKTEVPEFVWRGDKETVCAYLEGVYIGDGTVQGGEVTVGSLSSIDKKFLEDIQILLINLGIKSSLTQMREEGMRSLPDGKGGKESYFYQTMYRLMVTSIPGCKLLEEATHIGRYRDNNDYLINLKKQGYIQKMYATFMGLEAMPNEDAYCLKVDTEEHLWVVNGMLTRNTEIFLPTDQDNTSVCNLASIVLSNHVEGGEIDWDKIADSVVIAMRHLDNVIDINFYPIPEAENANKRDRPVGLGIMGWASTLEQLEIPFDSTEAAKLLDELIEFISFAAITSSVVLADIRGSFSSFEKSHWAQGLVPMDTLAFLAKERKGGGLFENTVGSPPWDYARREVKRGMRNGTVMAIAPTATISLIASTSQSIEPNFSNVYSRNNISGKFIEVNENLANALKKEGIWYDVAEEIIINQGDIQHMEIPQRIKDVYKTAYQISPETFIAHAAIAQKWVDQGVSRNMYLTTRNYDELREIYLDAWRSGLKSTYYAFVQPGMRSESTYTYSEKNSRAHLNGNKQAATTVIDNELQTQACDINDPSCESCS